MSILATQNQLCVQYINSFLNKFFLLKKFSFRFRITLFLHSISFYFRFSINYTLYSCFLFKTLNARKLRIYIIYKKMRILYIRLSVEWFNYLKRSTFEISRSDRSSLWRQRHLCFKCIKFFWRSHYPAYYYYVFFQMCIFCVRIPFRNVNMRTLRGRLFYRALFYKCVFFSSKVQTFNWNEYNMKVRMLCGGKYMYCVVFLIRLSMIN